MEDASRNVQLNLIGEKVTDPVVHCCYGCDMPIRIYGRMIPCKHMYCYDCAVRFGSLCVRCQSNVERVEKLEPNKVHVCLFGAPAHTREICARTYLSSRDLEAHIDHRHNRDKSKTTTDSDKSSRSTSTTSAAAAGSNLITIPLQSTARRN